MLEFSKIIAPYMPFLAEHVYRELRLEDDPESVHLCDWPLLRQGSAGQAQVIEKMKVVRELVSQALERRASAGIKVRQPLSRLTVPGQALNAKEDAQLIGLICDEVNVKEVEIGGESEELTLDTEITPELAEEGEVRELTRNIQSLRKDAGLNPSDTINLILANEHKALLPKWQDEIKKSVNANSVELGSETKIDPTT